MVILSLHKFQYIVISFKYDKTLSDLCNAQIYKALVE